MDIKCPSSTMTDKMIWKNLDHLSLRDEVKFVIKDRMDFDWAKGVVEKYHLAEKVKILFSPVFHELESQSLAEWILKENLPVRMQLQIHKYIWSPETRGV
jgi:7-carboxy-7-deazaguanine synthase